jgi:hypothetical protein
MVVGTGRSTRRGPVRAAALALSGMLATLAVALGGTAGAAASTLASSDPDRIGDLTGPLAAAPANSVANPSDTIAR